MSIYSNYGISSGGIRGTYFPLDVQYAQSFDVLILFQNTNQIEHITTLNNLFMYKRNNI